ncbi:hypothetical protein RJ639_037356 [Escallonia herrerae]|uniref:Reverse transcriptase/retrotransposon-derived protein RNase H-like domain-containing protein n=1 Tax=Escallonia herrerae TaxID=1293975 RepID=A0AA88WRK6_9ASTE|nr:hypothetical protein RJ639_037356 [Escallonia herrerae]
MSKSTERCLPFFRAIRKAKDFVWMNDCQKSFEDLKQYLVSPPLTKLLTREDRFFYLSMSEVAVNAVLVQEDNNKQKPIYYRRFYLSRSESQLFGYHNFPIKIMRPTSEGIWISWMKCRLKPRNAQPQ